MQSLGLVDKFDYDKYLLKDPTNAPPPFLGASNEFNDIKSLKENE